MTIRTAFQIGAFQFTGFQEGALRPDDGGRITVWPYRDRKEERKQQEDETSVVLLEVLTRQARQRGAAFMVSASVQFARILTAQLAATKIDAGVGIGLSLDAATLCKAELRSSIAVVDTELEDFFKDLQGGDDLVALVLDDEVW